MPKSILHVTGSVNHSSYITFILSTVVGTLPTVIHLILSNPLRLVLSLSSSFFEQGNWGTEKSNYLPLTSGNQSQEWLQQPGIVVCFKPNSTLPSECPKLIPQEYLFHLRSECGVHYNIIHPFVFFLRLVRGQEEGLSAALGYWPHQLYFLNCPGSVHWTHCSLCKTQ